MLELIARFLIIGALAFGGGQAALPLVERLPWLIPDGSRLFSSLRASACLTRRPGRF